MAFPESLDDLQAVLTKLNRGRLGLPVAWSTAARAAAEEVVEALFRPGHKLAIYGTLAPGEVNHQQIAGLGGQWSNAALRGHRGTIDQGIHRGLPGLRLDPHGPVMAVKLLVSIKLPGAWVRLDRFESTEMQRLLVPLEQGGRLVGVANVYTLRRAMMELLV